MAGENPSALPAADISRSQETGLAIEVNGIWFALTDIRTVRIKRFANPDVVQIIIDLKNGEIPIEIDFRVDTSRMREGNQITREFSVRDKQVQTELERIIAAWERAESELRSRIVGAIAEQTGGRLLGVRAD